MGFLHNKDILKVFLNFTHTHILTFIKGLLPLYKGIEMSESERCPYCKSDNLENIKGKLVCMDCGSVIKESTVSSDSPRFFGYEDIKKRSTHSFSSYYPETRTEKRNLKIANVEIDSIVNELHLPYFVRNEAEQYYKKLIRERKIRKDVVLATAAALVYIVCMKSQIPVAMKSVTGASDARKTAVNKWYLEVLQSLKIKVPQISITSLALRYAKQLDMSTECISYINDIADKVKDSVKFIGKDPNGVAAAIVYTVAKMFDYALSQEKAADMASVTEITVRSRVEVLPNILKQRSSRDYPMLEKLS